MALGTGRGDFRFGLVRHADIVHTVTIGTNWGLQIALRKVFVVDAIESLGILLKMALFADLILTDTELPAAGNVKRGMGIAGDIIVAVGAIQFIAVY